MRRLTVALVALALGGGVVFNAASSNAAPVQWSGNGHWYEAVLVPGGVNLDETYWGGITWSAARDAATARGGWLADIESAYENDFVFSLVTQNMWLRESTGSLLGPWLGGFQPPGSEETAAGWMWVTGKLLSYTNWETAEPSNGYLGPLPPGQTSRSEDAVHFFRESSKWNDYPSWAPTLGYVVESSAVPEPCTLIVWSLLGASGVGLGWWRRRKRAG